MSQLSQLYQETLMEHARSPRNYGPLAGCTHSCHGQNPLCGDDYILELALDDKTINAAHFHGDGCAISKASASLLTMLVQQQPREQALELCRAFIAMLTDEQQSTLAQLPPHLQIFAGVREYPMRVKCASLIWRTLESILTGGKGSISTENYDTSA